LVDLHNHTPWCHHATGHPREYLARARDLRIPVYGFSEHSPWMFEYPGERLSPTEAEFAEYWDLMVALREEERAAGALDLRIGIELDLIPAKRAHAEAFLARYPLDHHIGSVHNIGDWIFDHPDHLDTWKGRDVTRVFEDCFAILADALSWGIVDIVGHLDLPKKFGHRPPSDTLLALVRDLVPAIRRSGAAVEINTAGLDKPAAEFYPGRAVLELLVAESIPLTLGSDAHKPSEVGRHRAAALALLCDLGVTHVAAFRRRQIEMIPLAE
jgi:histidinol-phosphatase (PHP family)